MNVIIANKYKELLANLDIDVIKSMDGIFTAEELISTFSHFFFNKMILDITAIENYEDIENVKKISMGLDMSKVILLLDDSPESMTPAYLSKLISMGIYNFTKQVENVKYLMDNPNSYKDVASLQDLDGNVSIENNYEAPMNSTIIGVKNVTEHAGATSLVYMMKKQLQQNYSVLAIEINRTDFKFYNDSELVSTTHADLGKVFLKSQGYDIILLDLNDSSSEDSCHEVIYLIEPTTIKLNKMIRRNKMIFNKLKGKKIVLNKSLLDKKDVMDFEFESGSQIFFNLPPLDDKINRNKVLDDMLAKLSFIRQGGVEEFSDSKILGIFNKKG